MIRIIYLLCFVCLSTLVAAQSPEQKLKDKGITLPNATAPAANYVNVVRSGNLLFLAGKGPTLADGSWITGKVGRDLTVDSSYAIAKIVAINHIAVLKQELGDLGKVKRIVKVLGMMNCHSDFKDHAKVLNGYSDFMVEIFDEKGKHARSAVGVNYLPHNMAMEVEIVVEVEGPSAAAGNSSIRVNSN